jgi:hypothetical protein
MAREKECYRDNLEMIHSRYPDHDMLSMDEVKQVLGWGDARTVRKYLGKLFVNGRISKAALARYMCG